MPGSPRFDTPGSYHHVWARGLDRGTLFFDDEDRDMYVTCAESAFARSSTKCLAWCEMTNHAHFVVQTGRVHLSKVFHVLQTRYAMHFNRRHGRVGHVFQGRFGSSLREDGAGLDVTVAYVHLNPLRGSLCRSMEELAEYRWSGHAELLGRSPTRLVDADATLRLFGRGDEDARASMCSFLASALEADPAVRLDPREHVDLVFTARTQADVRGAGVQSVRARSADLDRWAAELGARAVRRDAWIATGGSLPRLLEVVSRLLGSSLADVATGRRTAGASQARAVLAHVGCDLLDLPGAEVGRLTGASRQAVSEARSRGRQLAARLGLDAAYLLKASSGPSSSSQVTPLDWRLAPGVARVT